MCKWLIMQVSSCLALCMTYLLRFPVNRQWMPWGDLQVLTQRCAVNLNLLKCNIVCFQSHLLCKTINFRGKRKNIYSEKSEKGRHFGLCHWPPVCTCIYFMNGNLRSMAVWMGAQTSKGGRGWRNREEIGASIVPDKNAMLRRLHDWHCRRHIRLRVETF